MKAKGEDRMKAKNEKTVRGHSYCQRCCQETSVVMLTGYSWGSMECDRCGRCSQLALVARRIGMAQ